MPERVTSFIRFMATPVAEFLAESQRMGGWRVLFSHMSPSLADSGAHVAVAALSGRHYIIGRQWPNHALQPTPGVRFVFRCAVHLPSRRG